jgi:hypothetical protein
MQPAASPPWVGGDVLVELWAVTLGRNSIRQHFIQLHACKSEIAYLYWWKKGIVWTLESDIQWMH